MITAMLPLVLYVCITVLYTFVECCEVSGSAYEAVYVQFFVVYATDR